MQRTLEFSSHVWAKEKCDFWRKVTADLSRNSKVYKGIATSYGNMFAKTRDVADLNIAIAYLKTCIEIDPLDTPAYGQLTGAYSYFMQKDSAIKYLKMTDKLDSNAVLPEVRKILKTE